MVVEPSSGDSFTAFPTPEFYENRLPRVYAKNRTIYTKENISVEDTEEAIRNMFVKIAIFLQVNGGYGGQRVPVLEIVDRLVQVQPTSTIDALRQTFNRSRASPTPTSSNDRRTL